MRKYTKSICGVTLVLIIVAGLATGLGIAVKRNTKYQATINNIYAKSYYEAMDILADSELKLAKINISASHDIQSTLLNDVATDCALIVDRLSDLNGQNDNITMVISMLNQLGDYCTYLANKSATGTLTQEESANLQTLHNLIVELQQSLTASGVNMAEGAPIAKDLTKGITLLFEVSRHFSSDKVSYPELIYDGPFSSVKATGEASLLADKAEIDEEAGKKKIAELFKDATDIQKTGETSGAMPCHIYEFKQNGELGYAEITKAGGVLKEYNCYRSVVDPKITTDECKGLAEEYAEQCGFNNLSVVWVSNKNSTVYVNMAYTQNDTIYYNDLIQLKIASDDGKLVGINATNYIVNHKQREPKEIIYTKTQASQKITDKLEVETIRLAVIPYKNTERITYEFFGSYNNDYYFVYVCAEQNCELEVKRVSEQDGAFIIS